MPSSRVRKILPAVSAVLFCIITMTTCEKPERVAKLETLDTLAGDITYTSATLRGIIKDMGSSPIDEHGIYVSENEKPIQNNSRYNPLGPASSTDTFSYNCGGLSKGTLYYYRAYLFVNSQPVYGEVRKFRTRSTGVPVFKSATLTDTSMTSLVVEAEISGDGGETVTRRGFCWSTSVDPVITGSADTTVNGSEKGSYTGTIDGLNANTTYYVRAYAINLKGTSYSNNIIVTTHGLPVLSITAISDTSMAGAVSGGNITNTGGVPILAKGVCWSTSSTPTATLPTKTSDGTGGGTFISTLTGLTRNTIYYVRAYATNKYGTAYSSDELSFKTKKLTPQASTLQATSVQSSSATLNGSVIANGLNTSVTFEYGLTTSYGYSIEAIPGTATGNSSTSVYADISGLNPGKTYHFRVKAVSSDGNSYGGDLTFDTPAVPPTSVTLPANPVGNNTAQLNGTVNANGSNAFVTFEYGRTTSYGSSITATPDTVKGISAVTVIATLTGLSEGTEYHFRVKAVNIGGTSYGVDQSFTTLVPPTVNTLNANPVGPFSATLNGNVNANDLSSTVTFEYGLTTSYGMTVIASQSPVTGNSSTNVSASVTGILSSKTYHFRVKAVSSGGTSYGIDQTFDTPPALTVTDFDNNIYNVVDIGTQSWMQSNLMTTHFSNGDPVPVVSDNASWSGQISGALSWYNNDAASYKSIYGGLYNWFAATDVRNICPSGWHVPTVSDWTVLESYLGGPSFAGPKLKEAGTAHWSAAEGTNESGFTALGVGYRIESGAFQGNGYDEYWWSSDEASSTLATARRLSWGMTRNEDGYKIDGFNIRCIKGGLPLSETETATAVASVSVTFNGKINPNGSSTTVSFEYGTTASYGYEVAASQSTVSGSLPVQVYSSINGLTQNTLYHYRVKAVNADGTSYGKDLTFTTPDFASDIEGNLYNTVIIGAQVWFQDNLKTTKFTDNTSIPFKPVDVDWRYISTPAYCWPGNNIANKPTLGAVYNWNVVPGDKICPTGWRIPTQADFNTLITYLGGASTAGGKLKALTGWNNPNTDASNSSGFSGKSAGIRDKDGAYLLFGTHGGFWSSNIYDGSQAYYMQLLYNAANVIITNYYYPAGMSIRCIKN